MHDIRWVINLGNSICGVSLLVLPYCFSQCGILLGIILLLFSAMLTTWSCHLLLENVFVCKTASYEGIAKELYGRYGKLLVEISSAILNIGCCSAFFVIISDLMPGVISWASGNPLPSNVNIFILALLAVTVILPLSLVRNLEPLNFISLGSMMFYVLLTMQLFIWAVIVITADEDWKTLLTTVPLIKMNGITSVLPIYALAFSCHLQLMAMTREVVGEVNEGMWEELYRMKWISRGAVMLVGVVYGSVSLFGHTAFCINGVKPDVLSNFNNNAIAQITRCGFAISVLLSFPFMINPCRATLYSLIYGRTDKYIPTQKHVIITSSIVFMAFVVAISTPNVAVVVGLTGAISGAIICYLFPSFSYLCNPKINHTQKQSRKAYILIIIGIILLTGGTLSAIRTNNEDESHEMVINVGGDELPIMNVGGDEQPIIDVGGDELPIIDSNPVNIGKIENEDVNDDVGRVEHEVDQPMIPAGPGNMLDNPLIGQLGQALTGARTLQEDKGTEEGKQTEGNNNNGEVNNNNNNNKVDNSDVEINTIEVKDNKEVNNNNGIDVGVNNNNNNNVNDKEGDDTIGKQDVDKQGQENNNNNNNNNRQDEIDKNTELGNNRREMRDSRFHSPL